MNSSQVMEYSRQGWNNLGTNEKIACFVVSLIYTAGTIGVCIKAFHEIVAGDWWMGAVFATAAALAAFVNVLVAAGVGSVGRARHRPVSG